VRSLCRRDGSVGSGTRESDRLRQRVIGYGWRSTRRAAGTSPPEEGPPEGAAGRGTWRPLTGVGCSEIVEVARAASHCGAPPLFGQQKRLGSRPFGQQKRLGRSSRCPFITWRCGGTACGGEPCGATRLTRATLLRPTTSDCARAGSACAHATHTWAWHFFSGIRRVEIGGLRRHSSHGSAASTHRRQRSAAARPPRRQSRPK